MDVQTKVDLVKRSPTEEVIVENELKELFETNNHPQHYIGYEISGFLHIGSLIYPSYKIKDFLDAGCRCTVFLADWHTWINHKLGGDLEKIKIAAKYYEEAFKLISPKIKVVLGSDLYENNDDYWKNVVKISQKATLARITRCLTIMGRKETENLDFAQLMYPSMQAADIKELDVDIAHAGMDQRKVHVLARDVFPKLKWKAPVAVHHHLLPGLMKPLRENFEEKEELDVEISSKMSKSKPWTAIFIHDTRSEIESKLAKAWCPPGTAVGNAPLEYVKYLIFREFKKFVVERPEKYGGEKIYKDYASVERDFINGNLHPDDLKKAVADYLDKIIDPFRKHFQKSAKKKLLEIYKKTDVTR